MGVRTCNDQVENGKERSMFRLSALVMPTITSALVATGTVGVPFSYTPIATGTQPITFTVSTLPPGLSFDGTIISGIPTTSGTTPVTLTARNAAGSSAKTLTLMITPPLRKIYLPLTMRQG
jgi:Putative Ig domain